MHFTTDQWIQVTIAACMAIPILTVIIRYVRKWTKALAQLLPNGGKSLADRVNDTASRMQKLEKNIERRLNDQDKTLEFQNHEIATIKQISIEKNKTTQAIYELLTKRK